jgi:hypothetical protein
MHEHILEVVTNDKLKAILQARAPQLVNRGCLVRAGVDFKNDIGLDLHANLQCQDAAAKAAGTSATVYDQAAVQSKGTSFIN